MTKPSGSEKRTEIAGHALAQGDLDSDLIAELEAQLAARDAIIAEYRALFERLAAGPAPVESAAPLEEDD